MKRANIAAGFILLTISILAYLTAAQFPTTGSETDPGTFPMLLSIILGGLTILLLIQTAVKRTVDSDEHGPVRHPLLSMAVILLYLLAVERVGFFIATPLIIVLFLLLSKIRNWILVVSLPIGLTLFIYVLFEKLLSVPLPNGSWLA
jgi:putative tricarboxylic transport membrane protein